MSDPTSRKTPAGKGGGAFGNGLESATEHAAPGSVSQQFCDTFAAEVHRLPDGKGGFSQISIIHPGALRPTNRGGRN